jgi:hypothetical protein
VFHLQRKELLRIASGGSGLPAKARKWRP